MVIKNNMAFKERMELDMLRAIQVLGVTPPLSPMQLTEYCRKLQLPNKQIN